MAPACAVEEALYFAGQALDAAAFFGFFTGDVEDGEAVLVQREDLAGTFGDTDFALAGGADGVVEGDGAAGDGLKAVGRLWLGSGRGRWDVVPFAGFYEGVELGGAKVGRVVFFVAFDGGRDAVIELFQDVDGFVFGVATQADDGGDG